jgi:phenylacetic acid degradation operon negative regulatory protein
MQEMGNTSPLGRPLTARSVIASLLLGMHPPRMAAQRLVQWCELFGIAPGTARVALSRMAERGELVADGGVYELAGRVRSRQAAQDWSLEPQLREWSGTRWSVAVVTREARAARARAAFRTAMRRCRFAEVREGCWTRPDNLPRAAAPAEAWAVVDAQCSWWTGRPEGDERALADSLFRPKEWASRAAALTDELAQVTDELRAGRTDALADAFTLGAATLQHVRNDPLLPREVLPGGWPGPRLRDAYRVYQRVFGAAAAAWFRAAERGEGSGDRR